MEIDFTSSYDRKTNTHQQQRTLDAMAKRNESNWRANMFSRGKKENPITLIHDDISYGGWHRRNIYLYEMFFPARNSVVINY